MLIKKCPHCFCIVETMVEHDDGSFLCLKCGKTGEAEKVTEDKTKNKRIWQMNAICAEYFHNALHKSATARQYCTDRGLTSDDIKNFNIGYANADWTATKQYLNQKGFSDEELVEAGICFVAKTGKVYDFFRNRLVFPIKDALGHITGFSGRAIGDDERKYINTPETPIFHKKEGFFGIDKFNTETPFVVICEGQMDVIACFRANVPNVVATLGTAMTLTHARYLSYIVDKAYLCFDGDTAGQTALAKAEALLNGVGVKTVHVNLPQGCKDPDEVFVKMGANALRDAIIT